MAVPTGFANSDASRAGALALEEPPVTKLAPPAPLKQKPNLVTRAFANLVRENAQSARGVHRVVLTAETVPGTRGEPARCRTADERTVVHVERAGNGTPYLIGGALRLRSARLGSWAGFPEERLASVSVTDGEVYLASGCEHAWLNGVALREKGGVKQARIAPDVTHRLRVLDSKGDVVSVRVSAKTV